MLLDWFFHFLHLSVILVNSTFWLFRPTLRMAQMTLVLTAFSWIVLGYFYGFGYCFLTDWHWQLKASLGETNLPNSYIEYLLEKVSGRDWSSFEADVLTGFVMAISVVGCTIQTLRQRATA